MYRDYYAMKLAYPVRLTDVGVVPAVLGQGRIVTGRLTKIRIVIVM